MLSKRCVRHLCDSQLPPHGGLHEFRIYTHPTSPPLLLLAIRNNTARPKITQNFLKKITSSAEAALVVGSKQRPEHRVNPEEPPAQAPAETSGLQTPTCHHGCEGMGTLLNHTRQ